MPKAELWLRMSEEEAKQLVQASADELAAAIDRLFVHGNYINIEARVVEDAPKQLPEPTNPETEEE